MGVTDDVLREKGEKKRWRRRTGGELCESVECFGKNKEQKRVKENKKGKKEKKEKSKGIFLVKGERKC